MAGWASSGVRTVLKLCVVGGLGRMGRTVAALAEGDADFEVASVLETDDAIAAVQGEPGGPDELSSSRLLLTSDAARAIEACDVVIDFSLPAGFENLVKSLNGQPRPLVTGTTGIEGKENRLSSLAAKKAVVNAPNMSAGVNILFALAGLVAGLAGDGADIEIVEAHHRTKKDVPSGTAIEIAGRIAKATGRSVAVGREKGTQERGGQVFIHSLRLGGIAGDHSVNLSLEGEVLKLEHRALSRTCFAAGALRAAKFAHDAAPGLYSMLDVLGLKSLER